MVVLFLIVTQCQKDDAITNEENATGTQDVISRKIPFQNSPHFQIINPKVNQLNVSLNAVPDNQRSFDSDSILILTDEVLYMTYANTHTYTFKLLRENPEYFIENIVLHYNTETQTYDEYLLQYDVSEDEFIDIANGGTLSENANTYISKLDNGTFSNNLSRVSCSYSCQTISIPCTGRDHHPFGDTTCPLLGTTGAATQIQACGTSCIVIDDPSFDPSNPPIETGGGGSTVYTNPYTLQTCTQTNGNPGFIGMDGACLRPLLPIQRIEQCLGITSSWLNNPNNSQAVTQIDNILKLNQCNDLSRSFIIEFTKIVEKIPTARLDRYIELIDMIEDDPWALIQDCAQQNGLDIDNYQYLYEHTIPQECQNRLESLPDGFKDQPLNTGNAAVVNVDYYSVEITTRPDINGDGNPDSDAEIFNAYKNNFHNLASGGQENFSFSCNNPIGNNFANVGWEFVPYFTSDWGLWLSNNPVKAIFEIDAWAEGFPFAFMADDGAIMISEFTSHYWIGCTIQTPNTGTQPFSGNRQWGYITNLNGNLELYARAVDVARISDLIDSLPPYGNNNECQEDTYYNIGEATWSNLQYEIRQFIIDNGGQAAVIPKTAIRFDKTKLREVLESNESIDQILCD